jgi:hypothetical protein
MFGAFAAIAIVAIGIAHLRAKPSPPPATTANQRYFATPAPTGQEELLEDITQLMSVGEAYRAIPHSRTRFDLAAARMEAQEAVYLDRLFVLTDLAMVERVQTQLWLRSGGKHGSVQENHRRILVHLNALESPQRLRRVHTLVREAIEEQRQYLAMWLESGRANYFSPAAPLIRSSHVKLIEAYSKLRALYPAEGPRNHQAFYDHLCALDFI